MHAVQLAVGLALEESASFNEAVPKILRAMCELQGWALGALWLVDSHGTESPLRYPLAPDPGSSWKTSPACIERYSSNRGWDLPDRRGKPGTPCPARIFRAKQIFPLFKEPGRLGCAADRRFQFITGKISWASWSVSPRICYVRRPSHLERVSELGAMISQFRPPERPRTAAASGAKNGGAGPHGRRHCTRL